MTLDEEKNLPACLDSVLWASEVVILDSGSRDRTVEIAKSRGCRVVTRTFDNWSAHQNWALQNIPFGSDWLLNLDADETVSPELSREIARITAQEQPDVAFRIRRRDYFSGTWLRHATFYPTWLVRLYRPESVSFERLVNPVAVVRGSTGSLHGHIDHQPFSKGATHWIERHNSYSTFEAIEYVKQDKLAFASSALRDPNSRRRLLKQIFSRLPGRPLLKFLYLYIAHRGFLDGAPGFHYCLLQAIYEYFISLKARELRRDELPAHGLGRQR